VSLAAGGQVVTAAATLRCAANSDPEELHERAQQAVEDAAVASLQERKKRVQEVCALRRHRCPAAACCHVMPYLTLTRWLSPVLCYAAGRHHESAAHGGSIDEGKPAE
jgi:hypothetical protein